jgi:hypothetical protein
MPRFQIHRGSGRGRTGELIVLTRWMKMAGSIHLHLQRDFHGMGQNGGIRTFAGELGFENESKYIVDIVLTRNICSMKLTSQYIQPKCEVGVVVLL